MNSKAIREMLNMTQEEFAQRYSIPLGTVRNWDARNCMPVYYASIFAEIISLKKRLSELEKLYM